MARRNVILAVVVLLFGLATNIVLSVFPERFPKAPSELWDGMLVIAALLYLVGGLILVVWAWRNRSKMPRIKLVWQYDRKRPPATPDTNEAEIQAIARAWREIEDRDPVDTLIILSAGIERGQLQGSHPAWEIFFAAYNGGVGEVRLVSARGSFKVAGQAYPRPAELKSPTSAKYGEIALFTVRQWIDPQDVPQLQQGQNHVVLQLSDLALEAVATNPVSGDERSFVVPLPERLQFDVRNHWNINPDFFSRFYRERLSADGPDETAGNQAAVSVQLVTGTPPFGDFTPVCAVRVMNEGTEHLEGKCLVRLEDHGITDMRDPLVVRTGGQITGNRTGRFTLSRGQHKLVPILFQDAVRRNEFRFIGEDGTNYLFMGKSCELVVAIYGADAPTKVRIRLDVGPNWNVNAKMEYL